jgi:DNA processing protein
MRQPPAGSSHAKYRVPFVISSGLARGIDTAAHGGALDTGTIAAVDGGIDIVYPRENEAL